MIANHEFSLSYLYGQPEGFVYKDIDQLLRFSDPLSISTYLDSPGCLIPARLTDYLKGCFAENNRLISEFTLFLQSRLAKLKFPPILFTCIGRKYATSFIDIALNSLSRLISFRNTLNDDCFTILVACDSEAEKILRDSALVGDLMTKGHLAILPLNEVLCVNALQAREANAYGWTIEMTYLVNCSHYSFLEACRRLKINALLAWPDWVFPENFYESVLGSLQVADVICIPCYRVRDSLIREQLKVKQNRNEPVTESEVIELVFKHHQRLGWSNQRLFFTNPPRLLWKVDDTAFCGAVLNLAPFGFKTERLEKAIKISLDPVDGNFISGYWNMRQVSALDGLLVDSIDDTACDSEGFVKPFSSAIFFSTVISQLNAFTLKSFSTLRVHSLLGREHERELCSLLYPHFDRFLNDFWPEVTKRISRARL